MDINKLVVPEGTEALTLYTGQAPSPLPPYDYQGFQYMAASADSFIRLVRDKGYIDRAVIFMNDDGFFAILDDGVCDRKQDTVRLRYGISTKAQEYGEIFGCGRMFTLKQMIDFFKRRDEKEIEGLPELLNALRNFKYVSNITGDFTYDSRNNYTFAVKVQEAEGTVRIPTSIFATLELFKNSGWEQSMEIEVEIQKPKDASDGGPLFLLTCPKYERYLEAAKELEEDKLKKALAGWLVVNGSTVG